MSVEAIAASTHMAPVRPPDYGLFKQNEYGHDAKYPTLPPLLASASRPTSSPTPKQSVSPSYADLRTGDKIAEHASSPPTGSWQDPNPIPPPPPKYTYPLPSIADALRRFKDVTPPSTEPGTSAPPPSHLAPSNNEQHVTFQDTDHSRHANRGQYLSYVAPAAAGLPPASQAVDRRRSSTEQSYYSSHSTQQPQIATQPEEWRHQYPPKGEVHSAAVYQTQLPYSHHADRRDSGPRLPQLAPVKGTYAPSLATPHSVPSPTSYPSTWHAAHVRDEDLKRPSRVAFGESVKRHLDVFDLEQSLIGISEPSLALHEFSEFYRLQALQKPAGPPNPEAIPSLQHIDEMMKHGSRIQESLNRLRDVVVSQQAEMAELSREQVPKNAADNDSVMQDDIKGNTSFGGLDTKKRRGRAPPPGKCHSCNRVDTPEWRRGPDGARTLCNACGLHYAKLTRKAGTQKSGQGSSSLRPKDVASPSR